MIVILEDMNLEDARARAERVVLDFALKHYMRVEDYRVTTDESKNRRDNESGQHSKSS